MPAMKYISLKQRPPKLHVNKGVREVIFTTISCMCDNEHYLRFKKDNNGDFKMSGMGFSLSNWQFRYEPHDIEWVADEEKWDEVIRMINTGTSLISEVKSR